MSALSLRLDNQELHDSYVPRGGDLFVVPVDLNQQKTLLALNHSIVAG